jgi:hypothetical protein
MSKPTAVSFDAKWQRESDARTLTEAKQIMGDPNRLKGAAKAAQSMIKDKAEEVKALRTVANKAAPRSGGKVAKKR